MTAPSPLPPLSRDMHPLQAGPQASGGLHLAFRLWRLWSRVSSSGVPRLGLVDLTPFLLLPGSAPLPPTSAWVFSSLRGAAACLGGPGGGRRCPRHPSSVEAGHMAHSLPPGAQSSAPADSGSSEDEAASEARSTASDCPSLLSAAAVEDGLGERGRGGRALGGASGAGHGADQRALQGPRPWTSRASRRTWRRS